MEREKVSPQNKSAKPGSGESPWSLRNGIGCESLRPHSCQIIKLHFQQQLKLLPEKKASKVALWMEAAVCFVLRWGFMHPRLDSN